MTRKYKHYKRENSASAVYETKQENKVDSFVKYILCFFDKNRLKRKTNDRTKD